MDIEKLICEVKKRRNLWDKYSKDYHNRGINRKRWNEISVLLNIPVDQCKSKWNGLRDTFKKKLKELPKPRFEDDADQCFTSQWKYFNHLLFLGDQNTPRKSTHKIKLEEKQEGVNNARISRIELDNISSTNSEEPTSANTMKKSYKTKQKKRNDTDEKLLRLEENKLPMFEELANDPERMFLLSLLPYLKNIPAERKLLVGHKIQGILLEETSISDQTSSLFSPGSTTNGQ